MGSTSRRNERLRIQPWWNARRSLGAQPVADAAGPERSLLEAQPALYRRTVVGVFLGLVAIVAVSAVAGSSAGTRQSLVAVDSPVGRPPSLEASSAGRVDRAGAGAPAGASTPVELAPPIVPGDPSTVTPEAGRATVPGPPSPAPSTNAGAPSAGESDPEPPPAEAGPAPTTAVATPTTVPAGKPVQPTNTAAPAAPVAPTTTHRSLVTTTSSPRSTLPTASTAASGSVGAPASMKTSSTIAGKTTTATEPDGLDCNPNYSPCVPNADEVDCDSGLGDGPTYVTGPVRVIGRDVYHLDSDGDGIGCG